MHDASVSERVVRPPHGGQIAVSDTGPPAGAPRDASPSAPPSATPLVLVPGVGGPRGAFYHQVNALRERCRVVALSLNPAKGRGLGAIASSVADVLATMDELGVARADLLGASFGTTIVTRLALEHPSRVRRLVWVAPPVVRHAPWRRTFGAGWLFGGALLAYSAPRHHAWTRASGREVAIVPGHHMPYLSYPQAFSDVLAAFLEREDASPAATSIDND